MSLCVVELKWPSPLQTEVQRAAAIAEVREAYVQSLDGPRLVTEEESPNPLGRGWIVKARVAEQTVFARVRIHTSGAILFVLVVTGRSASEIDSGVSARFLDSFRVP